MSIEEIREQMLTQDNRATSYPIFIIVEDKKVYNVVNDIDGRERNEYYEGSLCDSCTLANEQDYPLGDCDDCPEDAFVEYRIERDVPNLYAGFFFTAEAAQAHLDANRHHYNTTAHTYAISAYHNHELRAVMQYLCGKDLR